MSREIAGAIAPTDFHPMVGLRTKGNFVIGKVTATGKTAGGNPVITLKLVDMDGTTSISKSKGVYEEVDVSVGDLVQVVGSLTDLRDKLPQLAIGDDVTITYINDVPSKKGHAKKIFKVTVN